MRFGMKNRIGRAAGHDRALARLDGSQRLGCDRPGVPLQEPRHPRHEEGSDVS